MGLKAFPIVLGAVLVFSSIHAENWTTDYSAGLTAASQRDRAVFLFFTGSDWCGYCQALDREVLSSSTAAQPALASHPHVLDTLGVTAAQPDSRCRRG